MTEADQALAELLRRLRALDYDFVTPTPATHRRVLARTGKAEARSLRDIFGWSLPFAPATLPATLLDLLERGEALRRDGADLRSSVRVSGVAGKLFLHSAFPTESPDSVFLGPDSYRFVRFLAAELQGGPAVESLVDMGAGAGLGGIFAAGLLPGAAVTLVDSNPRALRLARINAAAADVEVRTIEASALEAVPGVADLVIANPPFIIDRGGPAYRDGGDMLGARLSYQWTVAAARRLPPRGRMLLYSGSAIADGRDGLREALCSALPALGCAFRYEEIDPDIFGEQLECEPYRTVERIAAIGAVIEKAADEVAAKSP